MDILDILQNDFSRTLIHLIGEAIEDDVDEYEVTEDGALIVEFHGQRLSVCVRGV